MNLKPLMKQKTLGSIGQDAQPNIANPASILKKKKPAVSPVPNLMKRLTGK